MPKDFNLPEYLKTVMTCKRYKQVRGVGKTQRCFYCPFCGKEYLLHTAALANHVYMNHKYAKIPQTPLFKCRMCDIMFFEMTALAFHRHSHRNENDYTYKEQDDEISSEEIVEEVIIPPAVDEPDDEPVPQADEPMLQSSPEPATQDAPEPDQVTDQEENRQLEIESQLWQMVRTSQRLRIGSEIFQPQRCYYCPFCGKEYVIHVFKLKAHIESCHYMEKTRKTIVCEKCNVDFFTDQAYKFHQLSHVQETNYVYMKELITVPELPSPPRLTALKRRRRKRVAAATSEEGSSDEGPRRPLPRFSKSAVGGVNREKGRASKERLLNSCKFYCPFCGWKYALRYRALQTHIKRYHQDAHIPNATYKCEFCVASFFRENVLVNHIMHQHNSGTRTDPDGLQILDALDALSYEMFYQLTRPENDDEYDNVDLDQFFVCCTCGVWFATQAEMNTHCQSHVSLPPAPADDDVVEMVPNPSPSPDDDSPPPPPAEVRTYAARSGTRKTLAVQRQHAAMTETVEPAVVPIQAPALTYSSARRYKPQLTIRELLARQRAAKQIRSAHAQKIISVEEQVTVKQEPTDQTVTLLTYDNQLSAVLAATGMNAIANVNVESGDVTSSRHFVAEVSEVLDGVSIKQEPVDDVADTSSDLSVLNTSSVTDGVLGSVSVLNTWSVTDGVVGSDSVLNTSSVTDGVVGSVSIKTEPVDVSREEWAAERELADVIKLEPLTCRICFETFDNECDMAEHLLRNYGIQYCTVCRIELSTAAEYTRHMLQNH